MTHSIFRRLSLLTLLLVLATALPSLAEEGQVYTIKKGDTLWGLSERFMNDPYYWPNMWAVNPEVTNPHLIFPGQKVRILNGRLEIIPAYPGGERATAREDTAPVEALPAAETVASIRSTGSGVGFVLTDEAALGTLVDSVDNRVLLTKNDQVFLKMTAPEEVTVGDTYGLFRRGKEIAHPVTGEPVGTMMNNLGFLQVTGHSGQTVTAKIGDVFREVERGAVLYEYIPPRKEIALRRSTSHASGLLIATRDEKLTQGTDDIVFFNLGTDDGLTSGNLVYITRPRQVSDAILAKAGEIELPDEVLGAAVVIEASRQTASAIIIKSVDAMFIGDRVTVVGD